MTHLLPQPLSNSKFLCPQNPSLPITAALRRNYTLLDAIIRAALLNLYWCYIFSFLCAGLFHAVLLMLHLFMTPTAPTGLIAQGYFVVLECVKNNRKVNCFNN